MANLLQRKDNKPMTVRDLVNAITLSNEYRNAKRSPKHAEFLDKPVILSSDEEGNDMLGLYGIEITKQGITLWPTHI